MQTLRPNTCHLLVKMFAIVKAFQEEFTLTVKYFPVISAFGAHGLLSIGNKQTKKILLVFGTYESPKTNVYTKNDVNNPQR